MPVVRTMPNTSSTIGLGATGLCFSTKVTEHLRKLSEEIFR
ncbi:pyrroline-5-carboxylate reductase family protein [Paenibacillus sp. FSL H7-689]|nr:pyrroline-5-carboxylate reductase [Paenibacillus sp. FSL H7-689]